MMVALLIAGGFVLLVAGGEILVRGSVGVATRFGVSKLVIGLTLVGFGTSAPELVTSLQAAFVGAPGIAVGNVVGSNIANILLILGISALIHPLACDPMAIRRDGMVMLAATILLVGLGMLGAIDRWAGVVLLALLAAYLAFTFHIERKSRDKAGEMLEHEAEDASPANLSLPLNLGLAVGGIVLVVVGADLLVRGAVDVARLMGVSEAVIGLTIVAVGTSLPELVTSVMAAIKRHGDVAIGNVIGSNIFNILAILGVTAAIHPIPFPAEIAALDVWVALATAVALLLFAASGARLNRIEGGILAAAYAGYVGYLAAGAL